MQVLASSFWRWPFSVFVIIKLDPIHHDNLLVSVHFHVVLHVFYMKHVLLCYLLMFVFPAQRTGPPGLKQKPRNHAILDLQVR